MYFSTILFHFKDIDFRKIDLTIICELLFLNWCHYLDKFMVIAITYSRKFLRIETDGFIIV